MAVLSVLQSGYGLLLLSLLFLSHTASAQVTCPNPVAASVSNPKVADGLVAKVVATGLSGPRGIIFDKGGHLLVVEPGKGVSALTLRDDGGSCLSVTKKTLVVNDSTLNHGIELGPAGERLYASSVDTVYNWNYDSSKATITPASRRTLISGMYNTDHASRTLELSKKNAYMLIVNRGSSANIDNLALDKSSGHAQVKAFDLSKRGTKTYDFTKSGTLLAWGVRNSVGLAEEPVQGRIYTVENSVDNMMRDGQDVHNDNPGEKMNFIGYVNGRTSPNTGTNFGYPRCFAAWDPSKLPNNSGIDTGTQFAIQGSGVSDAFCQANTTAPRLTFLAHQAPLDLKFDNPGSSAYITFHGSFNRVPAAGYKVGLIKFANADPVAPRNSRTSVIDMVGNPNETLCNSVRCFRPVAMAWDSKGRLFFSSDATGEIWAVSRADGKPLNGNPVA